MRKGSKQLIADLVAGRSGNPTEAMETIMRSPRLRAAYEEQIAARNALASLDTATMTDSERTDLRRGVWTSLNTAPAANTVPATPWAWRAAGAAAALAVVVGGAALLMQGNSADSGGTAELTANRATTTADAAGAPLSGQDHGQEDGGENQPQAFETEEVLRRYADLVRTDGAPAFNLDDDKVRCADLEELDGQRPLAAFDVDGVEYQAWVSDDLVADAIDETTPITFVDVETCTVQPVIR